MVGILIPSGISNRGKILERVWPKLVRLQNWLGGSLPSLPRRITPKYPQHTPKIHLGIPPKGLWATTRHIPPKCQWQSLVKTALDGIYLHGSPPQKKHKELKHFCLLAVWRTYFKQKTICSPYIRKVVKSSGDFFTLLGIQTKKWPPQNAQQLGGWMMGFFAQSSTPLAAAWCDVEISSIHPGGRWDLLAQLHLVTKRHDM